MRQLRIYVKGQVIGVGFRAWTRLKARELGIKGWVKNVYNKPEIFGVNGGVEICCQGSQEQLNEFLKLVKKGPETAVVEETIEFWEQPQQIMEDFNVIK
ncbi:MAG: acylphosphatase [Patescibacteria group bacterium]|nr:MAG: acylphosphatase [Patescibacteria group bacterium]